MATDRPMRTLTRALSLSAVLTLTGGVLSGCIFAGGFDGVNRATLVKTPPATDGSIEPWPTDTAPASEPAAPPSDGASDGDGQDAPATEPPASRAPIGP